MFGVTNKYATSFLSQAPAPPSRAALDLNDCTRKPVGNIIEYCSTYGPMTFYSTLWSRFLSLQPKGFFTAAFLGKISITLYAYPVIPCRSCNGQVHIAMDESGALDVLGLAETDTYSAAEVRRAYRRMALLYHPDKQQSSGKRDDDAKQRFRDITSAKNFLLEKLLGTSFIPTPPKHPKPDLDRPDLLRQKRQARQARWCNNVESVVPVQPSEPPRLVVWACHVCEMAAMGGYSPGARKDRVIPCVQPGPHTLCFCGHPLSDHRHLGIPSKDGWERCEKPGCLCVRFNYVRPYSTCTCGHRSVEHSATAFFACKVAGCMCQTYHDPGTCHVCSHDWVSHRTELRYSVPSKLRETSRSSSSSSEKLFVRRRPVSANPANMATVTKSLPRSVFEVKRPLSARAPGTQAGKHVARVMGALSARGPPSSASAPAGPSGPSGPLGPLGSSGPVPLSSQRNSNPQIRPETPRSNRPRTPTPRTSQPRSYVPRKPDEAPPPSSSPDASPTVALRSEVGAKGSPVLTATASTAPSADLPWVYSRGPLRARLMEPRNSVSHPRSGERGGRWAHPTVASGLQDL